MAAPVGSRPLRSISRVSRASPPTSRHEPSSSLATRSPSSRNSPTCRPWVRSATGRSATRAPASSTTSTLASSSTTCGSTRTSRSRSSTTSTAANARSCRRCSSPTHRPLDDPELVDFGGPLMQWHDHDNLCWGLDDSGNPVVKGITDDAGNCAPGTVKAGGENPMVHVWIAPHECGPFAALEGHGAGQVAGDGSARRPMRARSRSDRDRRSGRGGPRRRTTRTCRSTSAGSKA